MNNKKQTQKLTFVFLSWKDINNPKSGGSEVVHQEISDRLVKEGHTVIHLVPGFKGCKARDNVNGVEIIRVGDSLFSFFKLPFYYKKHLLHKTDYLIDVFNCFGSFSCFMGAKIESVFLIHHVQDKIWFHQTVFPFIPPLNYVGWLIEKLKLFGIATFFNGKVITISDSTKKDLMNLSFSEHQVNIIREGCDINHVKNVHSVKKNEVFTILFFGRLVKMKNPLAVLQAFNKFNQKHPDTQLWIAGGEGGDGTFEKIYRYILKHNIINQVTLFGRVSNKQKMKLMREAHVIAVTSVKEGWGLIVTEANSQGTPAITYNVPGLKDSNKGGKLTDKNNVDSLVKDFEMLYNDKSLYNKLKEDSYNHSKQFTFDNMYDDFKAVLFK